MSNLGSDDTKLVRLTAPGGVDSITHGAEPQMSVLPLQLDADFDIMYQAFQVREAVHE